jgi:hypothetical protein
VGYSNYEATTMVAREYYINTKEVHGRWKQGASLPSLPSLQILHKRMIGVEGLSVDDAVRLDEGRKHG